MKNLQKESGLPISIDGNNLIYNKAIFPIEPKTRSYEDAKDVYLEKNAKNQDLYYMYRYFEGDKAKIFEENKSEYDITVLKNGKIGPEPIKTVGHYHSNVPEAEISYPEVYEVIAGEITYLLQSKPSKDDKVDVIIIEAKTGDKIVVPPNYGHVSINRGNSVAISSNIQRRDLPASADYNTLAKTNGAALYYDGKDWAENYNYQIASCQIVHPKDKPEWGLEKNKPLYTSFTESPEKFKWLIEPQCFDFSDVWQKI